MLSFISNGVLYSDQRVQKYIEKNKYRLSFGITIDGTKKLHDSCRVFPDGRGSFDIVSESVKDAIKKGFVKDTKVTLAPENLMYLNEAIPYLFSLGIKTVNANPVFENVWKKEHAKIYYKELIKLADYLIDNNMTEEYNTSLFADFIGQPQTPEDNKNFCGGNAQMLAISPEGKFYPCVRFMPYSLHGDNSPDCSIGNLDRGIDTKENNEFICSLCNITRRSQSTDECFNCPVSTGCAWCTAYNFDVFGTPDKRATFICDMHKARCLANSYYWGKLGKPFELNLKQEDIDFLKGDDTNV